MTPLKDGDTSPPWWLAVTKSLLPSQGSTIHWWTAVLAWSKINCSYPLFPLPSMALSSYAEENIYFPHYIQSGNLLFNYYLCDMFSGSFFLLVVLTWIFFILIFTWDTTSECNTLCVFWLEETTFVLLYRYSICLSEPGTVLFFNQRIHMGPMVNLEFTNFLFRGLQLDCLLLLISVNSFSYVRSFSLRRCGM